MRSMISALVFAVVAATGVTAQADNVACRDGSSSVEGRGACSHHGGVQKHRSERKSARKHAEPRVDRHARENEHVQTRRRSPDMDIQPRERRDPNWIDRRNDRTHQSNQPTAMCNDGEVSYSMHHQGACSDHGGVARWLD